MGVCVRACACAWNGCLNEFSSRKGTVVDFYGTVMIILVPKYREIFVQLNDCTSLQ